MPFSEQLSFPTYCLFHSLNRSENATATKRNGEKKTTRVGRHDESEKLAVNIERVIRSLKNTWTIIKPTCQRSARRVAECLSGTTVRRKIGCENIGKRKGETDRGEKGEKKR